MTEEQHRQLLEHLEFISGQLHAMVALQHMQLNVAKFIANPHSPDRTPWSLSVEQYRPEDGYEDAYQAAYNLMMNLGRR